MYKPSKKTLYITSAFAAVAGLVGVYSYWNDIAYVVCDKIYPEANDGEVRLKDNQGNRYSLLNHGDGKETALFDDDRSVTFHREKDGSLVWDAGLAVFYQVLQQATIFFMDLILLQLAWMDEL